MVNVVFRVKVSDELVQSLMQAVRDWDMQHDPNHEGKVQFELLTEADWPAEKMADILKSVSPKPEFFYTGKYCICPTNALCPVHGDKGSVA